MEGENYDIITKVKYASIIPRAIPKICNEELNSKYSLLPVVKRRQHMKDLEA